jgi:hypothetical protein
MKHYPRCPKCRRQIEKLLVVTRGTFKEYLTMYLNGDEDSDDEERNNVSYAYYCPMCDNELFDSYPKASKFMKQEE